MSYLDDLKSKLTDIICDTTRDEKSKQDVIYVQPQGIRDVLLTLKTDFQFDMLIDVISFDWSKYVDKKPARFEMSYLLYSTQNNNRIQVRTYLADDQKPQIETVMDIYPSADWPERECWDMMGITILNHPNHKRLLMWEEFEGHPLQKDYPLDKRQSIPVLDELL